MNLKDKFMKMDKTKRRVICFIILSFCFIFAYGTIQPHHPTYTTNIHYQKADVKSLKSLEGNSSKKNSEKKQKKNNETKKVSSVTSDTKKENTKKQETNKKETTKKKTKTYVTKKNTTTSHASTKNKSKKNTTKKEDVIHVKVTIIGMGNTLFSGTIEETKGQSTAYSAMVKLVHSHGSSVSGSSSYVTGIAGLKEKEHGARSGWMYSVNGKTPMKSAGSCYLSDGDSLTWHYVNYE